jgi:hypothetical protein
MGHKKQYAIYLAVKMKSEMQAKVSAYFKVPSPLFARNVCFYLPVAKPQKIMAPSYLAENEQNRMIMGDMKTKMLSQKFGALCVFCSFNLPFIKQKSGQKQQNPGHLKGIAAGTIFFLTGKTTFETCL